MAKTVAERKDDERKRKAARLKELGAQELKMVIYSGTRECLDQLKQAHGFDDDKAGDEELITYLIHNISNCDTSQFKHLFEIPTNEG